MPTIPDTSKTPSRRSVASQILSRLRRRGRGTVVTPQALADLGSREAVDKALQRLVAQGVIRRLARGIYDYPKHHAVLGTLTPSAEAVARALAVRDQTRLQPSGAYAANLLGLTEQVPAKVVFLTDGPSRTTQVGPLRIQLRHTTPRNMMTAGRLSGLLIQAFRYFGEEGVTPQRVAHLRDTLPDDARHGLLRDLLLAPAWMQPILRELAQE